MGIGMTPMLGLDTNHDGESLTAHGLYFFRANDDMGTLIANAPVAERQGGETGESAGSASLVCLTCSQTTRDPSECTDRP